MKKTLIGIAILIALGALLYFNRDRFSLTLTGKTMRLESPAFENRGKIPPKYTCNGENISPPLTFSEVPEGTKSFVLIIEDPDVSKSVRPDGIWNHLIVWNIPPTTSKLEEGVAPPGNLGINTSGNRGYQGPCPPDREHRYIFKLYAVDTLLSLPDTASKEDVIKALDGRKLAETELIGLYEQPKR